MYQIEMFVFNTVEPEKEWQPTKGYFSTAEDALLVAVHAHSLDYGTEIRVINSETKEVVSLEEAIAIEVFGKPQGGAFA